MTGIRSLSGRAALFAAYIALVTAAHARVLQALHELSQQSDAASHVVLIPIIAIALVVRNRGVVFESVTFDRARAVPIILIGALLAAVPGRDWLSVNVLGVVVMCGGGFVLFFGPGASRRAMFPLAFLGLAVPIPAPVLDGAVWTLKAGSAHAVEALFRLSGTPFFREGYVFSLPSVAIEIADACSGIRSSIALTLTSLLAGHLFLRKAWSRTVLVLVVIPITILKNGLRIVTLTLLAVHVDPGFLTGQLHHEGGILFFALALALLMPVLWLLARAEGLGAFTFPGLAQARYGPVESNGPPTGA